MILKINENIELVPISLDYVDEIHESFNNEIIEFLPIESLSKKINDTTELVERSIKQRNSGTDVVWVILNKNEFAGCCGIHTIQSRKPHFGIWVKKEQHYQIGGQKKLKVDEYRIYKKNAVGNL